MLVARECSPSDVEALSRRSSALGIPEAEAVRLLGELQAAGDCTSALVLRLPRTHRSWSAVAQELNRRGVISGIRDAKQPFAMRAVPGQLGLEMERPLPEPVADRSSAAEV